MGERERREEGRGRDKEGWEMGAKDGKGGRGKLRVEGRKRKD